MLVATGGRGAHHTRTCSSVIERWLLTSCVVGLNPTGCSMTKLRINATWEIEVDADDYDYGDEEQPPLPELVHGLISDDPRGIMDLEEGNWSALRIGLSVSPA